MQVNKKTTKKVENNYITVTQADVERVRAVEKNGKLTVYFSLTLNGVEIHDCRVVEGKNGDFIAMPSKKDKKSDKYYSYVYANLSPEDSKAILEKVETEVNS